MSTELWDRHTCANVLVSPQSIFHLNLFLFFSHSRSVWYYVSPPFKSPSTFCAFFSFSLPLIKIFHLLSGPLLNLLSVTRGCPHPSWCFYYLCLFFSHKAPSDSIPILTKPQRFTPPFTPRRLRMLEFICRWDSGTWDEPLQARFTSLPWTISPPFNLWRVQGSTLFETCLVSMHTSAGGAGGVDKKKKKEKAKVLCAQTDDCVCFGCCQQWGRAIYALVLKGGRAFDPCDVIFFVSGTRYGLPYSLPGEKKITWHKSFGQGGGSGVGGGVRRYTEHEWALHSSQQAENRNPRGCISSISLWSMNWSANQAPYSKSRPEDPLGKSYVIITVQNPKALGKNQLSILAKALQRVNNRSKAVRLSFVQGGDHLGAWKFDYPSRFVWACMYLQYV